MILHFYIFSIKVRLYLKLYIYSQKLGIIFKEKIKNEDLNLSCLIILLVHREFYMILYKKREQDIMVKVFISHSTKDFQLVVALEKYLNAYGIEVYIAERDYQPGKPLSKKIMQNIDICDYFLVIYTFNGKESNFVNQEIGYWMKKKRYEDLIPFVEKGINPEALLCGVEYIEFDPLNPKIGIANVIKYINNQIKIKKKQLIFDVGVGLGIAGLTFLIFYGLSKLGEE